MKYYKVLRPDGSCVNGGKGKWYLPKKKGDGTWTPGKWMPEIEGELESCENGYHVCRPGDLIHWLNEVIFEVEYKGVIVEGDNKCIVRKARLLRRLESWDEKCAGLFAADCAEHVLPIYEKNYPDDDRPRKAISAARDYANGKITKDELAAARAAAHASWAAAKDAARAAARAASWEAAKEAARAAVRAAALDAVRDAPHPTSWPTTWDALRATAWDVAWAAARDAECKWQTKKLFEYLEE